MNRSNEEIESNTPVAKYSEVREGEMGSSRHALAEIPAYYEEEYGEGIERLEVGFCQWCCCWSNWDLQVACFDLQSELCRQRESRAREARRFRIYELDPKLHCQI
jgi:hypothetical protein